MLIKFRECLDILLSMGAKWTSSDLRDVYGLTILHAAVRFSEFWPTDFIQAISGREDVVHLLMDNDEDHEDQEERYEQHVP